MPKASLRRKVKANVSHNNDQDLHESVKENKEVISKHSCKKNLLKYGAVIKEVQVLIPRHTEHVETDTVLREVNKTNSQSKKFKSLKQKAGTELRKKSSKVTSIFKVQENLQSEDLFYHPLITKEVKITLEKCIAVEQEHKNKLSSDHLDLLPEDDGNAKKVPNKIGRGTKRKIGKADEGDTKPKKIKEKESNEKSKSSSKKEKIPDVTALDFSNDSKSPSDKPWNFKISSWNINGIRAWLEKNGLSYLHHEKPDIMCIQETKCSDDKLPEEVKGIEGYHVYWLSGDKEGYSGVGLISKEEPIEVKYGIGISDHDHEGRVITAEYEQFYLVSTYVPNAGRGLVRLDYRMTWDKDFQTYLENLNSKKPVILCGDLNVAHEEIDLANPKTNKKNAGFTKEEREGFSTLLEKGFLDTFRHLYPDAKGAYTFWTYMMNARAKNVGWRLDYFVISERFADNLCDSVIRKDVLGSDHCPITLFLSL